LGKKEMKNLVFISAQPADLYFVWQIDVQLHNFRKFGYSKLAQVLVYLKKNQKISEDWRILEKKYPETKFFYYEDVDQIERFIVNFGYIPLLRPYILRKHFTQHPELKESAIFYHDSDIIFTKALDFSSWLNDDVNYLSYTGNEERTSNYLNYDYFKGKAEQVEELKVGDFFKVAPLEKFTKLFGINEEIVKINNDVTGGAQYLLKNIDAKFWADVFDGCLFLKTGMHNYNQKFFKGKTAQDRENNGYQAWCADMWSVLWNIWKRGATTQCPKELDFAWATDTIDKWDRVYIYHDAGKTEGTKLFNKKGHLVITQNGKAGGKYVNNVGTPFEDDLSWVDKNYCSYKYVKEILETGSENQ
jgi:hypothetical protein